MKKEPDFIARLYFLTTEQGGRVGYASSGYRPHIKFSHSEYLTTGEQVYIHKDEVLPGENVNAEIRIIATDVFKENLESGMLFKFCEGERTIGFGEILEIINPELQKSINYIPANLANFFTLNLEFRKVHNGLFETFEDGEPVKLRLNDFPEFPMWTLWYGSQSMDFDDAPKNWSINYDNTNIP